MDDAVRRTAQVGRERESSPCESFTHENRQSNAAVRQPAEQVSWRTGAAQIVAIYDPHGSPERGERAEPQVARPIDHEQISVDARKHAAQREGLVEPRV